MPIQQAVIDGCVGSYGPIRRVYAGQFRIGFAATDFPPETAAISNGSSPIAGQEGGAAGEAARIGVAGGQGGGSGGQVDAEAPGGR